jgi:hypothetical protein
MMTIQCLLRRWIVIIIKKDPGRRGRGRGRAADGHVFRTASPPEGLACHDQGQAMNELISQSVPENIASAFIGHVVACFDTKSGDKRIKDYGYALGFNMKDMMRTIIIVGSNYTVTWEQTLSMLDPAMVTKMIEQLPPQLTATLIDEKVIMDNAILSAAPDMTTRMGPLPFSARPRMGALPSSARTDTVPRCDTPRPAYAGGVYYGMPPPPQYGMMQAAPPPQYGMMQAPPQYGMMQAPPQYGMMPAPPQYYSMPPPQYYSMPPPQYVPAMHETEEEPSEVYIL